MQRRAVVEQQRRPGGERRNVPVPHHPRAGREVEYAVVARTSVCSTCSLRCCSSVPPAPCTMHFGAPCCTRRKHDEERMIEWKPRELDRRARGLAAKSSHNARCGRPQGRVGEGHTARPRRARALAALRRRYAAYPGNRRSCRCSSSPRPRTEPSVLSGRSDRRRPARRSRASTSTTSRPGSRSRASRSPSPACWEESRQRDRRPGHRSHEAPERCGPPDRRAGDGTIGGGPGPHPRRQSHRRRHDGAEDSLRNSDGLRGTSARPACGRHRGSQHRPDLHGRRRNPRAGARNPISR